MSAQKQNVDWDKLLLDIELRTEQVIQMKRVERWKVFATFLTAVAAVAGVIVALAHLLR